jgi:hypothetical protein
VVQPLQLPAAEQQSNVKLEPEAVSVPLLVAAEPVIALPSEPPASCPITLAPETPFAPPDSWPATLSTGEFWYGTNSLWTALYPAATWSHLPHDKSGYSQKVFWWAEDYYWRDNLEPDLIVTGRRLDADAPPLIASKATNGFHEELQSFMLVGVEIPSAGCWEISGSYNGQQLSFVVWVAP